MQLSCKQNKRLSIYSANYGRVANGHMMQCPNNPHFTDTQPVYEGKFETLKIKALKVIAPKSNIFKSIFCLKVKILSKVIFHLGEQLA